MTESETDDTFETDSWLSAVFAAAAGPVIDSAFADRVLARLRKRQQMRLVVIGGTAATAAAFVLWQLSGLTLSLSLAGADSLSTPSWLTQSPTLAMAGAFALVGFTAWMFTDEA